MWIPNVQFGLYFMMLLFMEKINHPVAKGKCIELPWL